MQQEQETAVYSESQLAEALSVVSYVQAKSPFYREHFAGADGSGPGGFFALPFTTKEHLSERNADFLCVPIPKIAEYVATSGTTGDAVTIYLTTADLDRLGQNECDSFRLMGATENDVFQLLTTVDKQFMAGMAYCLGAQKLEAGMIRIGPGVPRLQWHSIMAYKPTKLIAVPSFILKLIDYAKDHRIDLHATSVDSIICIGEPIRNNDFSLNALGKRITEEWNVQLFSTYASTEMATAFSECVAGKGCHTNENLIFLEVISEDGSPAKNGQLGEIVITTLKVEGTPLVRFRTGDLAHVYYDACSCGNKSPRLGPIVGRKNQMIKFKGTTLYPKAIFDVLDQLEGIALYQVQVRKNDFSNDEVTVVLDEQSEANYPAEKLAVSFKSALKVIPEIAYMETSELRKLVFKEEKRKPDKIVFF